MAFVLCLVPPLRADLVKGGNGWQIYVNGGTCDIPPGSVGCSGGAAPVPSGTASTYSLTAGYTDDHVFTTGAYAQATMTGDAGSFQDKLYINSTGDVLASAGVSVQNRFAFNNLTQGSDGLYHVATFLWFDGKIVPQTSYPQPSGAIDFQFNATGWNPATGASGGAPCTLISQENNSMPAPVSVDGNGYKTTLPMSPYPYSQVYNLDCAFASPNAGFGGNLALSTNGWLFWALADFSDTAGIYFDLPSGATVTDATGTFQNTAPPSSVPEPTSAILLATGLLAVIRRVRHPKTRAVTPRIACCKSSVIVG